MPWFWAFLLRLLQRFVAFSHQGWAATVCRVLRWETCTGVARTRVFFVRGGGLSSQTSARQRLHPEYRQSGTGSVVINAVLPRRHCLKGHEKTKLEARDQAKVLEQQGSPNIFRHCTWQLRGLFSPQGDRLTENVTLEQKSTPARARPLSRPTGGTRGRRKLSADACRHRPEHGCALATAGSLTVSSGQRSTRYWSSSSRHFPQQKEVCGHLGTVEDRGETCDKYFQTVEEFLVPDAMAHCWCIAPMRWRELVSAGSAEELPGPGADFGAGMRVVSAKPPSSRCAVNSSRQAWRCSWWDAARHRGRR